jgi:Asp/Glu/hydantoin racemase
MTAPIRIWHQSMTELEDHPEYAAALGRHAAAVVDPSTEVTFHGLRRGTHPGITPARTLHSPYAYHVLLRQVLEHAMTAEENGYDAVVVGSYSDPFLKEARAAVDIPVVSAAESTLITSCSVSTHAVLVTMSRAISRLIHRIVREHGFGERVVAVTYLEPDLDEIALSAALTEPAAFIDAFAAGARKGIEQFADVVIPAEGIMNEILFAHGVQEIDDVSVMDTSAVAWLYAEYMVKLRRATGLHVGRRWDYPRLDPCLVARLRESDAAGWAKG